VSSLKDIPIQIPEVWSAAWYRRHFVEVLGKADVRAATGIGVTVTSDGNSEATINAVADVATAIELHDSLPGAHHSAIDAHDVDAAAHGSTIAAAITAHEGLSNPHPTYLTQAEGDARYPQKSVTTVANASGGATVDTEARAQLNALLAALRATGVIGT